MEAHFEELKAFMENQIPFNKHLGIIAEELREGYARLKLPYRDEFVGDRRRPALHGGLIATLIDVCGGTATWTHFSKDDGIATLDIRVDYLRPGPDEDLIAESHVLRVGNRVAVVNTRVYPVKDAGTIIAEGKAVYNIRRASDL
ncbi:MAG: PaaI family thioesterase [Deltaproteobacteria bacterium]|nr:PaaI family thioesterase [Deltaproteobacteria bacterium]